MTQVIAVSINVNLPTSRHIAVYMCQKPILLAKARRWARQVRPRSGRTVRHTILHSRWHSGTYTFALKNYMHPGWRPSLLWWSALKNYMQPGCLHYTAEASCQVSEFAVISSRTATEGASSWPLQEGSRWVWGHRRSIRSI